MSPCSLEARQIWLSSPHKTERPSFEWQPATLSVCQCRHWSRITFGRQIKWNCKWEKSWRRMALLEAEKEGWTDGFLGLCGDVTRHEFVEGILFMESISKVSSILNKLIMKSHKTVVSQVSLPDLESNSFNHLNYRRMGWDAVGLVIVTKWKWVLKPTVLFILERKS